jgi:hypothetical protein
LSTPPKLVLAVVDGCKPAMLERAIETGRAPSFAAVIERGTYVETGATAAFPSVTPVCAGTIGTGHFQDVHRIPSMNWYSREEARYIEYGSSFSAARRFGFAKQLTDTVFNMNAEHLPADVPTVFERLDDAGVRTAGTTYLIYRGRHRHQVSRELALTRLAGALWRRDVLGPKELFYADIFASRDTGCRSQLGMPGMRDQHAGCVSSYMVEHDLFDFLLLSLPDNDTYSHKHGPAAQVTSIANADRQLERMMHAAGGPAPFLDEHAVIIVADHSHAKVERRIDLGDAFEDWTVLAPGAKPGEAEIALSPAQRSGMVYVLVEDARHAIPPRLAKAALAVDGIDLAMWRDHDSDQGVIASRAGMLRFARGGEVRDPRGGEWTVDGQLAVLAGEIRDGVLHTDEYPDALARVWAALQCPTSGDVLLSAGAGWEFADWGGVDHVGGGSHGSLHRSDSVGALAYCGVEAPHDHGAFSIADVTPMIWRHFGVAA